MEILERDYHRSQFVPAWDIFAAALPWSKKNGRVCGIAHIWIICTGSPLPGYFFDSLASYLANTLFKGLRQLWEDPQQKYPNSDFGERRITRSLIHLVCRLFDGIGIKESSQFILCVWNIPRDSCTFLKKDLGIDQVPMRQCGGQIPRTFNNYSLNSNGRNSIVCIQFSKPFWDAIHLITLD
jgi:hypothetical protein